MWRKRLQIQQHKEAEEKIRKLFISTPQIPALLEKNKQFFQQRPLTSQSQTEKKSDTLMSNPAVLSLVEKNKLYYKDRVSLMSKGDSCSLEFMGTIAMSPSLYYLNRTLKAPEAKSDDDILIHFHPAGRKRHNFIEKIHIPNLDILRITLFQKQPSTCWVEHPSIPPKTWDELPQKSLDVQTVKEYLSTNSAFHELREKGHASFFREESKSRPVGTTKIPIHGFCLSAIAEDVSMSVLEVKKPENLYLEISQYAKCKRELLQNNIVIDDMLGMPVDSMSILLCSKTPLLRARSPETIFDKVDPNDLQLQFFGFEYIYTPPINDAATASPVQEVRWDIVSDQIDLLAQSEWQEKGSHSHKTRTKNTGVTLPEDPFYTSDGSPLPSSTKNSLLKLLVCPPSSSIKSD